MEPAKHIAVRRCCDNDDDRLHVVPLEQAPVSEYVNCAVEDDRCRRLPRPLLLRAGVSSRLMDRIETALFEFPGLLFASSLNSVKPHFCFSASLRLVEASTRQEPRPAHAHITQRQTASSGFSTQLEMNGKPTFRFTFTPTTPRRRFEMNEREEEGIERNTTQCCVLLCKQRWFFE